jgi:hypothetical protein
LICGRQTACWLVLIPVVLRTAILALLIAPLIVILTLAVVLLLLHLDKRMTLVLP